MANKWLIGGLILAAGVGGYFYLNKKEQGGGSASTPSPGQPQTASSGTSTPAPQTSDPDASMRNTLLQWATGTQNVPLYQAWINQLPSNELAQLYDILVNDWEASGKATVAQAAAWNFLVGKYPFLKYAGVKNGVKCSNFTCN